MSRSIDSEWNDRRPVPSFLPALILALLLPSVAQAGASAALLPGARPNVIVITTDDLTVNMMQSGLDAGLYPTLATELLAQGIVFDNSYVSNSLCCPSRATFMTGQYSHNHGVLGNSPPYGFDGFTDDSTLATWLQDAGYLTGFVGRYFNGYLGEKDLDGDGEIDPSEENYIPPGWGYWQAMFDPSTFRVYDFDMLNGDTLLVEHYDVEYKTTVVSQKATEFINLVEGLDDDAPFFLWVSTLVPHTEKAAEIDPVCYVAPTRAVETIRPEPQYQGTAAAVLLPRPPSFNEFDIVDKPDWLKSYTPDRMDGADVNCIEGVYREKVEAMRSVDDMVAAIVDALLANGETHSLLVFTSDNGYNHGEHRLLKKNYAYEETIRVPLYMRDLSAQDPIVIGDVVLNNDLAPTIVELAAATAGLEMDGRSLLPLFDAEPPPWRRRFLIEHFQLNNDVIPVYAAIRNTVGRPFLFVQYDPPPGQPLLPEQCLPGFCELYDMGVDPFQQRSLHDKPAAENVINSLSATLAEFRICAGQTCLDLED